MIRVMLDIWAKCLDDNRPKGIRAIKNYFKNYSPQKKIALVVELIPLVVFLALFLVGSFTSNYLLMCFGFVLTIICLFIFDITERMASKESANESGIEKQIEKYEKLFTLFEEKSGLKSGALPYIRRVLTTYVHDKKRSRDTVQNRAFSFFMGSTFTGAVSALIDASFKGDNAMTVISIFLGIAAIVAFSITGPAWDIWDMRNSGSLQNAISMLKGFEYIGLTNQEMEGVHEYRAPNNCIIYAEESTSIVFR